MPQVELTIPPDAHESKLLLDFCLRRGADYFTVTALYDGSDAQRLRVDQTIYDRITSFQVAKRRLAQTVTYVGQTRIREVACWRFDRESLRLILDISGGRLVMGGLNEPEDWTIYRDDIIFLGVVSHEGFVFLQLEENEVAEFVQMGIAFRYHRASRTET